MMSAKKEVIHSFCLFVAPASRALKSNKSLDQNADVQSENRISLEPSQVISDLDFYDLFKSPQNIIPFP